MILQNYSALEYNPQWFTSSTFDVDKTIVCLSRLKIIGSRLFAGNKTKVRLTKMILPWNLNVLTVWISLNKFQSRHSRLYDTVVWGNVTFFRVTSSLLMLSVTWIHYAAKAHMHYLSFQLLWVSHILDAHAWCFIRILIEPNKLRCSFLQKKKERKKDSTIFGL